MRTCENLVASVLCCGEVGALCKKLSVLQQLGVRAMKQQGLGLLYCLSVVYGPVFSFNYYTKLNSNRHLEETS